MIDVDSTPIECEGPCDVCGEDDYDEYFEIDGEATCPSCYNDQFGE